jgi:hypothetical protein
MRQTVTITAALYFIFVAMSFSILAQPNPVPRRDALERGLLGARLPLETGLAVSSTQGTPISAKYEINDGGFQLSVYTVKTEAFSDDTFLEVIVDFNTGTVSRVEPITDSGDLAAAQSQKAAMAGAKRSLEAATASTVKANAGYRAVSALPGLDGNRPVAEIILVRGSEWKLVSEPLD